MRGEKSIYELEVNLLKSFVVATFRALVSLLNWAFTNNTAKIMQIVKKNALI